MQVERFAAVAAAGFEQRLLVRRPVVAAELVHRRLQCGTRLAILADRDNARAFEGLGDALLGKRKDGDALAAYRTAAMLDPSDADLRLKYAETINRAGDLNGWAAELERIVAFAPEHGEAHARLAVARYYLGDHGGARAHVALAERFGGAVPPQLKAMIGE